MAKEKKIEKNEKTEKPETSEKTEKKGGGQIIENATRKSIFVVPVEDLKVYPDWHPRYDERSEYSADPAMIANVKLRGIQEPLRVEVVKKVTEYETGTFINKLEPGIYVVDGHQRRGWALAAKAELEAEGEPSDVQVPVWPISGDEDYLASLSIALNRHVEDDPIVTARKLRSISDRCGGDLSRVAVETGHAVGFVKQHLALLDLAKPVQNAVTKGDVAVSAAVKLAKLDKGEQVKALEEAKATAPAGDGRKKTAVTAKDLDRATKGEEAPTVKAPSKKEIKKRYEALDANDEGAAVSAQVRLALLAELRWVLTGERG